jgi:hypothetical protein
MAAPGIAIFRFFNPSLGAFDIRSADLGESEATEVPMGALTSVVYKPDEKTIEVYYISDEKTVVVQFSLLTTNTTMRPVE